MIVFTFTEILGIIVFGLVMLLLIGFRINDYFKKK